MSDSDQSQRLADQVLSADAPLQIVGGGSKAFYGRSPEGVPLSLEQHRGVVSYEPKELVITARSGTPLSELKAVLKQSGQMLPFEPPSFGQTATLGGTIACGFSGPRRPFVGAARDFVLGVRMINGKGELLHFGGEVMKNVAGYDLSRLMVGALGTLGPLLEVSLKVLPAPERAVTQVLEMDQADAIKTMNRLSGRPLPLSGACYLNGKLYLRLSGVADAVTVGADHIGGDSLDDSDLFWSSLREQKHEFFSTDQSLWRLSLPPHAPPVDLPESPAEQQLIDWGGGQRWVSGDWLPNEVFEIAGRAGGHATLFRGGDRNSERFSPLTPQLMALHRQLKQSFDHRGIFNPGRLYKDI
ncbi:MAG: glycolate oxidase subunit GlcE [Gammaproteobacteria bacterium]|nr:glycolate oxidase subunit GlcE [Gammaproteobacteria bacterium]